MREKELREYLTILYNKKWIIILITIMAIGISGIISYFILEPVYEAFSTLMVGKPHNINERIEYSDILLSEKLVATYGEIAKSRIVANEVIGNLGLDMDHEALSKKTSVAIVRDTEIIKIVVIDKDPVVATRIANEVSKVFIENITKIVQIDNIHIIDMAEVPVRPIKPKPRLNIVISAALGIMIAILLIFFLESMDNTLKTVEDIETHLQLQTIGMIPQIKRIQKENRQKNLGIVMSNKGSNTPVEEAFRTLRTNLRFLIEDKNIKSIVVTSPEPSEGKTTIAVNIAVATAQVNKKVLLIDGDLRKPSIHMFFMEFNLKGLTNILYQDLDYKKYIQPSNIENLDILTSGPIPPNPSELLGSNRMKVLLNRIKEEYDIVIIDSPPVGLVTDATVLSSTTDGAILVCAAGQSIIEEAKKTNYLLQKVNARILGVVLNKLPMKQREYYKYGYYYSYNNKKIINRRKDNKEKRAWENV